MMPPSNGGTSVANSIQSLENGLIVSCQPVTGGPMDTAPIVVAFALAALAGGAQELEPAPDPLEGGGGLGQEAEVQAGHALGLPPRNLTGALEARLREAFTAGLRILGRLDR